MTNLLGRLRKAGLQQNHTILDYGCGDNAIFIQFLNQKGYSRVAGYDPFVAEYAADPAEKNELFDCVVCNDTIEHCDDPRAMIQHCVSVLKPGGLLYIGTADSEPVQMDRLDRQLTRLHQPFHPIILTQASLEKLGAEAGQLIASYRRSYMDTCKPYVNYRFLDELSRATGYNLDRTLDPKISGRAIMKSPRLWFFGLFGYWFPSAYEPAVIIRKPA